MRQLILPLCLLLSGCGTAQLSSAGEAQATGADTARLMRDVRLLASDELGGRRTGTPGNAAARDFLLERYRELGLEAFPGGYAREFGFTGRDSARHQGVNVVGYVRGTEEPDRYLVVTAHYDHVGIGRPVNGDSVYNGADDNASGTAALLELARYFGNNRPEHSVIFAALDAEEMGLQGARALVAGPPVPRDAIALNVNMDMVGRNDRGELYAAGAYHYPQLRPALERVVSGAPVALRLGHDSPDLGSGDWTSQSDHGAFHAAGIPFVYFGVEDHPDYHRPSDDVAGIQPDFYARAVETIRRAIVELDRELR